jgi:hypothetical protein
MIKVSDIQELLCYHYNTRDIYIVQVTDRNGKDIQIWQERNSKKNPFVESFEHKGVRPYINDYEIEFDCLLTFIVNDEYEDEQLDELIASSMVAFMREVKLKNILQ